jgi:hypothetical protein
VELHSAHCACAAPRSIGGKNLQASPVCVATKSPCLRWLVWIGSNARTVLPGTSRRMSAPDEIGGKRWFCVTSPIAGSESPGRSIGIVRLLATQARPRALAQTLPKIRSPNRHVRRGQVWPAYVVSFVCRAAHALKSALTSVSELEGSASRQLQELLDGNWHVIALGKPSA